MVHGDRQFAEPLDCHRLDDGVSVLEVAVENWLTVFNAVS
jgi:hypothetical protein